MKWKNKNPSLHSIAEVVYANTGLTEKEMNDEEKEYRIYKMADAAAIIREAVKNGRKICVLADYDSDGINSATIMKLVIDTLHGDSYIRIPRRMSEGYGLNPKIVDEFPADSLLICVDNGIVAYEAVEKAKAKGMTVIILDHHMAADDGKLPCADVLIDPSAIGEADFRGYCGAGLAYKLAIELLGKEHPTVKKCLSCAAIATVTDVMPLIGENRLIVKSGLVNMMRAEGKTSGLAALMSLNGLDVAVDEKNIGFKIGPCLNAPGRLYDDGAMKAYKLLSFDGDAETAIALAREIIADNELRKTKKDEGVAKLEETIIRDGLADDVPLVIYEPGLEEGLVGLYAGHFAEEMKRPCIVFSDSKTDGILKGSARSFGDVHLKNLLDEHSDLIYKYGGHKGAAGLSVYKDNLEKFRTALKKSLAGYELPDTNFYDLEIEASEIPGFINELAEFAPFGEGNPEIEFKINNFVVSPSNKGFVQTMCNGKHGKVLNKDRITAVAFGMGEELTVKVDSKPKTLTLYGKLAMNISKYGSVQQIEVDSFDVVEKPVVRTSLATSLCTAAASK